MMHRAMAGAACLGLAVVSLASGQDVEFIEARAGYPLLLSWTTGTWDRVVVESATTTEGPFYFASPVLTTNAWAYIGTNELEFFRLEKVLAVRFEDEVIEEVVRNQIAATQVKLAPTSFVYDIELRPLAYLEAAFLGVTNLSGLEYATGLTNLVLSGNAIGDITALAGMEKMILLDIGYNAVPSLESLSGLVHLRELYADHNLLSNLAGLENMAHLEQAWLLQNALTNLVGLAGCTNLSILSLANNQVSDLAPLAGLLRLNTLDLSNNTQLDDLTPLLANAAAGGLGSNDTVGINANTNIPLAQIQALQGYGVTMIGP